MSGSGRKSISKWCKKGIPQLSPGDKHRDASPGKSDKFIHNVESQPRWRSPEIAGGKDPNFSSVLNIKDGREYSDPTMALDDEASYGTKMSPGLDDWRQQKQHHSLQIGYDRLARSRSRSPPCGLKRESVVNDSSIMAQPCEAFATGRCRRGDSCSYSHQDDKDYKDRRFYEGGMTDCREGRHRRGGASKYFPSDDTRKQPLLIGRSNDLCNNFFKGKCHKGESCQHAHHNADSDGIVKRSLHKVFREKENDKSKGASVEHQWDESCRSVNMPCKFFASGNCRNGKFCRFSHHGQTHDSLDNRSRDDWCWRSNNSGNEGHFKKGMKWSDTAFTDVGKLPEQNEKRNENVDITEQRAAPWSVDDRWEHNLNNEKKSRVFQKDNDEAVKRDEREHLQFETENIGAGMCFSESWSAENCLSDVEMSPAWNNSMLSSSNIVREEPGHSAQTSQSFNLDVNALRTGQQDITLEVSVNHHTSLTMHPLTSENSYTQSNPYLRGNAADCEDWMATRDSAMENIDLNISAVVLPCQSLVQNNQNLSAVTEPLSGLNAVSQIRNVISPHDPRRFIATSAPNQQLFKESTPSNKHDVVETNKPQIVTEILPCQNITSGEQCSELSNLSSSLARLLGNEQQLPQLFAALSGANSTGVITSSLSNSAGLIALLTAATSQPNAGVGSPRKYDPISNSIELIKAYISCPPACFEQSSFEEKAVKENKPEIRLQTLFPSSVSVGPRGGELYKTGNVEVELNNTSYQLNERDPVAKREGEENNGIVAEESKKSEDNANLAKIDGEGMDAEAKQNNHGKSHRAFKFSLAEFVKELLKPRWKDGQISKEDHKIIVKKVVEKVTGSIQGAHIPQSKEKIESYLSSSKPKVSKLIQAYVEKYQKS